MARLDVTITIPPLGEGWSGSPDQLLQFLVDNALFYFEGAVPTGQIGGAKPTEDVGIWYGPTSIEQYLNGKYQPISDVPIGLCSPWASVASVMPDNYLLCDGRSIIRADYPELFAVIGTTYGTESATTFSLPDMRGRSVVGAGIGDYIKQSITGRMKELIAGTYAGFEWIVKTTLHPNSPTASMRKATLNVASSDYTATRNPCIVMPWIIRFR